MLVIFYQTLDEKVPKWQNSNGIIGANPGKKNFDLQKTTRSHIMNSLLGVGFRPRPSMDHVESTLVYYRHGKLGNWQPWVDRLEEFLAGKKDY